MESIEEREIRSTQSPRSTNLRLHSNLAQQKTIKNEITHWLLPLNQHKPRKIFGQRLCIKTVRQTHS